MLLLSLDMVGIATTIIFCFFTLTDLMMMVMMMMKASLLMVGCLMLAVSRILVFFLDR